ncbi:MAG: prolyl oligopeptidase family serine peptidase [Sphaerochaetaceae bacterium]|nr:prolyl oligopeptidase family serine peptidase [Spirochaetales bacterium]MDY5499679.1 prolyl oligopeptidase family serine peptidase [Sphaerochaetaceae bacterium]
MDLAPLVPLSQSELFYEVLQKQGIPSELYIVRGAGHGTREFVQDGTRRAVLAFFNTYLRQGEEETCRN